MTSAAPPGPFDGRHFRALMRNYWRDLSRSGTASSGKQGNLLLSAVVNLAVLGFFAYFDAARREPVVLAHSLFVGACLMASVMLLPESPDIRQAKIDVLGCRLLTRRTLAAYSVGTQLVSAVILSLAFGGWALGSLAWRPDTSATTAAALAAGLVVCVFALNGLGFAAALRLGRRMGIARLRRVALMVQIGVILALALPTQLLPSSGWLELFLPLLPPAWFADLALGRAEPAKIGLVALLVAASTVVLTRLQVDLYYEAEGERVETAGPQGFSRRLLAACRRLPWLGRRWLPPATHAVADWILRVIGREDLSRIRGLLGWFTATAGFATTFFADPALGATFTLIGLAANLAEGLVATGQSANAPAAFVFQLVPVSGRDRIAGVQWAIFTRFGAWPCACIAAIAAMHLPWPAATVLALLLPTMVAGLLSLIFYIRPPRALARPPVDRFVMHALMTQAITGALLAASAIAFTLTLFGWLGLAADLVIALAAAALTAIATGAAGRRLERLEMND